jgi:hypothetical protein
MIALLKHGLEAELSSEDLVDALRRHADGLPAEDIEHLAKSVEQFLRGIPDAVEWALALSKDARCGRSVAFATGSILTYLFDDEDLLPESSFGNLGLLDDAYLVHAFVAKLAQAFPFVAELPDSAPDRRAFDVVAALLPDGVAHSLLRTCESTIQVAQALFASTPLDGASHPFQPQIRVDEALRAGNAP